MAPGLTSVHLVVLAAGRGSRLGLTPHKTLVPIRGSRGTLELILEEFLGHPAVSGATVVTGHAGAEVAARVAAVDPRVRVRHSRDFATTGLLRSLCVGTADLSPGGLLVLLGDSFYAREYRDAIVACDPHTTTVAVHAPARGPGVLATPADIPVVVSDGWVTGIGAGYPHTREMASGVYWAPQDWDVFRTADKRGVDSQAAALAQAVATAGPLSGVVRACEVPTDSFFDIDTPADLARARARLSDA